MEYDRNGNKTSETEFRATGTRLTTYTYDHANRLATTSDPGGGLTAYSYDAVGNRTDTTDPLGVTTVVTPNAANLPLQTAHWQGGALLDATTTTYDARNNPQVRATTSGTLALTSTYTFNGNNYLSVLQDANLGYAHVYTMTYSGDDLVRTILSSVVNNFYDVHYDAAKRVLCYKNRDSISLVAWEYYADGNRQYRYAGYNPIRTCPGWIGGNRTYGTATRERFFYDGQQLVRREAQPFTTPDPTTVTGASDYVYDGTGNLTQEIRVENLQSTPTTTTLTYGWGWQPGASRLTQFTAANGLTTTLDYDRQGRVVRRTTALGYSDYTYEGGTGWLLRETWHVTTTGPVSDLARYYYDNGRLARVEYAIDHDPAKGYATAQVQFNWHGDAVMGIGPNGYGYTKPQTRIGPATFDPWGATAYGDDPPPWPNYGWNAAWGYLWFGDLGLYYVHGRWYSPDLGRFLSPDEKGEYRYGSGQDAINWAWVGQQGADALWNSYWLFDFIRGHRSQIAQSARQHGLPPELLCAVMCNEQEGTWGQANAGLYQLGPESRGSALGDAELAAQLSYRFLLPVGQLLRQQSSIYGISSLFGAPNGFSIGSSNVKPMSTIRELLTAEAGGQIQKIQVTRPSPLLGPLGTQGGSLIDPGFVFDRDRWALVSLTFDVNNGIELAAANMDNARNNVPTGFTLETAGRLDWLRRAGWHNVGVPFPEDPNVKPSDRAKAIEYMKRTDVYWDKCSQWLQP